MFCGFGENKLVGDRMDDRFDYNYFEEMDGQC